MSLCAGWPTLDADVVGVGHGEPIVGGAADRVHELTENPYP